MTMRLWAALHTDADANRLRAQGLECPYADAHVVVISPMRVAVEDLHGENARPGVRQAMIVVPAKQWDWWSVELPPHFKSMRAGKLDRVVMVFEAEDEARIFLKSSAFGLRRTGV